MIPEVCDVKTSLAFLVLAAATSVTAAVRADDGYTEAKKRMQEGKVLADRGDYDQARMKYEQACALMRTFSCIRSLGAMEYKSGHYPEAYQHLVEALRDPLAMKLPDSMRREMEAMRQGALDATGHVEVDAPAGVTVWLDGNPAGTAPLTEPLTVMPGKHSLEVRGVAVQHADVDVSVKATVHVDLRPPASAIRPAAEAPPNPPASMTSAAPSHAPLVIDLPPSTPARPSYWGTPQTVGVVIAAAGLASLITGGVFAAQAQSDASRVSSDQSSIGPNGSTCVGTSVPSACSDLSNARNAQAQDRTFNLAFVGGGLALVAVGAGVFFLWPRSNTEHSVAVTGSVGPHEGGLLLRGDF